MAITLFLTLGLVMILTGGLLVARRRAVRQTPRNASLAAQPDEFSKVLDFSLKKLRDVFAREWILRKFQEVAGLSRDGVWKLCREVEDAVKADFRNHPEHRVVSLVDDTINYRLHLKIKDSSLGVPLRSCLNEVRGVWRVKYMRSDRRKKEPFRKRQLDCTPVR